MRRVLPLIVAIAAFAGAALLFIGNDPSVTKRVFDRFSVESTDDDGYSFAFAYLRRTGHRVGRLVTPIRNGFIERNAVVIRGGTFVAPFFLTNEREFDLRPKKKGEKAKPKFKGTSPLLTDAEEQFVRTGGRLVLGITSNAGPLIAHATMVNGAMKVFPIWPGLDGIAVSKINTMSEASLSPRAHVLFIANGEPVMTRETIGAGELIVFTFPEVLQNSNLRFDSHLALLLALAGGAPALHSRPIYFDEVVHGLRKDEGSIAILREWRLGPMLVVIAIIALLIFWRNAMRVGPAEDDFRETRSDAIDLVGSLGALYERTTTEEQALALYRDSLTRTVAMQTGLRGEQLQKRVNDLTHGGSDLAAINKAFEVLGGIHAHHR